MEICVIGGGYVGAVAAACFAEIGHRVVLIEKDLEKLSNYRQGRSSHYEPGLDELLGKVTQEGHLQFSDSIPEGVSRCEVIFVAVGTPARQDGTPDMVAVESVAREIGKNLPEYRLIVEKSTVPVNTCENIRRTVALASRRDVPFDIASNPEFLREGCAVQDFLYPDRIVVGVETDRARKIMVRIYEPLVSGAYHVRRNRAEVKTPPLLITDVKTAELIKHASNAFLAMKISFINAVSIICELVGASIDDLARGIGMDRRISPSFLQAGIGYGGSCFPKDLAAFRRISQQLGYDFRLLAEVARINDDQNVRFVQKVKEVLWTLEGKRIGVLGLAYKPNTDDVRDSPAIQVIGRLLEEGGCIAAYDPHAVENASAILPQISYASNPYEVAKDADALLLLTAWSEFRELDFERVRALMQSPNVFDGRNFLDGELLSRLGFNYLSIGRAKSKLSSPYGAEHAWTNSDQVRKSDTPKRSFET